MPPTQPPPNATATLPAATRVNLTRTISFEVLGQGDSLTANLENPALLIAGTLDETKSFMQWIDDAELNAKIAQVDFQQELVIALFRGKFGSSGYGITTQRVQSTATGVQITAKLEDPPADQNVSSVISYPYQIITIPRDQIDLTSKPVWSLLDTTGETLAQTRYP